MTAGIFARHGYWTGTCRPPDKHNRKGYHENLPVKHFMRCFYKTNVRESRCGRVLQPKEGFKEKAERVILDDGYPDDGSPWLVKFGANYYPPWRSVYPESTVICLYRDCEAIMKSGRRSFKVTKERLAAGFKVMNDALAGDANGSVFRVDYERVVSGDYSQLTPVFEREGVEMDSAVIDDFVDPGLRHF
jgi:hypothetical protein